MSSGEELVEVYHSANPMEAQVIKSLLESFGISCLLKSDAAPSVHVFTVDGLGEVKIMVRALMAETAKRLIKGDNDV